MNDDEIRSIAEGIARRGGLNRLLCLLGFTAPLRKQPSRMLRVDVRTLSTSVHQTLRVHVVELRTAFAAPMLRELSRCVRNAEPVLHHLLLVSEPGRRRVVVACDALHDGLRYIVLEPRAVRHSDIDALRELAAVTGESGTAAALRIHCALDRRRLTARFFRDIRGVRDNVARAWSGLPADATAERDALALLLLSRLMFLYFLQRRGLLAGDAAFLPRLLARWRRRRGTAGTFYRSVLRTLFFGVLNRRPERRTARALALGALPYLNGGLFEKHRLEHDRNALDLEDDVVIGVFDALLEKYRFTTAEFAATAGDDSIGAGIDPEMLGRIFEGLMPGDRRSRTGTFYTPAAAVDALVVETLALHLSVAAGVPSGTVREVLAGEPSQATDRDHERIARAAGRVRILDPACGSGAFLLGALARLEAAQGCACRDAGDPTDAIARRRRIVAESLHGVDLLEDAALICSLRLWLSLIPRCHDVGEVPPLPNLDRRIRQGDALVDPLDIGAAFAGRAMTTAAPPDLRPLLSQIEPAAREYITSAPESRAALRRSLVSLETRLARAWLDTLHRGLEHDVRELRARAADVDLFGAPAPAAIAARSRLSAVSSRLKEMEAFRSDLRGSRALPFFSFRVHFAETSGFDVVLSNPPWVRAHNWPPTVRQLLRERYRVCRDAGWPHAAALTATPHGAGAQVDLAFLFLERSLRLLRDGGTMGMVLPAKLIRSLAPGGARALLLAQSRIASIDDHSLDQRAVFDADAFTAVLVAQRVEPHAAAASSVSAPSSESVSFPASAHCASTPTVRVRMTRGESAALQFTMRAEDLPLRPGDPRSPWLLAPPECVAAFRAMQRAGSAVGESGLRVRRGAMTGANDILVVQDVEPKLGDLARIRTEGYYRRTGTDRRRFSGYVEASALRPVLRGTDVHPWRFEVERHVLWTPRNDDPAAAAPRRLASFLRRHAQSLGHPADRIGALQRLSPGMFGHKVVWSDLASDLRAAAVPANVRGVTGLCTPVVPMNTVYFIPTLCERDALILAGYLNSLPVRTFARAIAERAKDAHFRFFAWTMAVLPLPRSWRDGATADRIADISRRAHDARDIRQEDRAELDRLIACAYGLSADAIASIGELDAWLKGSAESGHGWLKGSAESTH
ncbi:MAG TPA: hypothetical protein VHG09_09540, partial [Longimicrobiales bacterium]|nr:hypothetical protein [Longimicrobiales bacterium]